MEIIIQYCEKCKRRGDLVRTKLAPRLKKEFPMATFTTKCLSFCGPGSQMPFVFINDALIYADSDDELITKIKDFINTESN